MKMRRKMATVVLTNDVLLGRGGKKKISTGGLKASSLGDRGVTLLLLQDALKRETPLFQLRCTLVQSMKPGGKKNNSATINSLLQTRKR
jgi:hypothetical protein